MQSMDYRRMGSMGGILPRISGESGANLQPGVSLGEGSGQVKTLASRLSKQSPNLDMGMGMGGFNFMSGPGTDVFAKMNIMSMSSSKPSSNGPIPYLPPGDPPQRDEELPDSEGNVWVERQGQLFPEHLTVCGHTLEIRRAKDGGKPLKSASVTDMFAVFRTFPGRPSKVETTVSNAAGHTSAATKTPDEGIIRTASSRAGHGFVICMIDGRTLEYRVESREEAQCWVDVLDERLRGVRHYADSLREGNLFKASKSGRWNSRWFLLRGGTLLYYSLPGGQEGGGGFKEQSLRTSEIRRVRACEGDDGRRKFCLALDIAKRGSTPERTITVDCGEVGNLLAWQTLLETCARELAVGWGENDMIGLADRDAGKRQMALLQGLRTLTRCNVVQVSCAREHALCVTCQGVALSWGSGTQGQLGLGDQMIRKEPTRVVGVSRVRQMVTGDLISACVTERGTVLVWGTVADSPPIWSPQPAFGSDACACRQVSCGLSHLAVVSEGGDVLTWGEGFAGQLGLGDALSRSEPTRVSLGDGKGSVIKRGRLLMAACGVWHTVALTEHGQVLTWGGNEHGQLGLGGKEPSLKPVLVRGFCTDAKLGDQPVKLVCAGQTTSCAVTATGCVFVWGKGEHGELGLGQTRLGEKRPCHVEELQDVVTVSLSHCVSAAVTRSGALYTWGAALAVQTLDDGGTPQAGGGEWKDSWAPREAMRLGDKVLHVSCGTRVCLALCSRGGAAPPMRGTPPEPYLSGQHHHHPIEEMTTIMQEAENLAREGIISTSECEEQRRQIFQASVEHIWAGVRRGWSNQVHSPLWHAKRGKRLPEEEDLHPKSCARVVRESHGRVRGGRCGRGEEVGEEAVKIERDDATSVACRVLNQLLSGENLAGAQREEGLERNGREEGLERRLSLIRSSLSLAYDASIPQQPPRAPSPPPLCPLPAKQDAPSEKRGRARRLPMWLEQRHTLAVGCRPHAMGGLASPRTTGTSVLARNGSGSESEGEWGEYVSPPNGSDM